MRLMIELIGTAVAAWLLYCSWPALAAIRVVVQ
jgi:hypothetical protein